MRVRVTPLLLSVPPIALAHGPKRIIQRIGCQHYRVGNAWLMSAVRNLWHVALEGVDFETLRRIQKISSVGMRGIAVPTSEVVGT
jgi:hypothetical protein